MRKVFTSPSKAWPFRNTVQDKLFFKVLPVNFNFVINNRFVAFQKKKSFDHWTIKKKNHYNLCHENMLKEKAKYHNKRNTQKNLTARTSN